jgi:hypothetical protein
MFSWSKTTSASPASTGNHPTHPFQSKYTRQQHLESYLQDPVLNRSTRKVSHDDTTYDSKFHIVM